MKSGVYTTVWWLVSWNQGCRPWVGDLSHECICRTIGWWSVSWNLLPRPLVDDCSHEHMWSKLLIGDLAHELWYLEPWLMTYLMKDDALTIAWWLVSCNPVTGSLIGELAHEIWYLVPGLVSWLMKSWIEDPWLVRCLTNRMITPLVGDAAHEIWFLISWLMDSLMNFCVQPFGWWLVSWDQVSQP